MEIKFDGKVAMVTGSGHGIGKVLALAFAESGARVVVNALHAEYADSTAKEIKNKGGEAIAIQADVSKSQEVNR
jgi:3-oxoacyl-[acyl-carrier protein] reductase